MVGQGPSNAMLEEVTLSFEVQATAAGPYGLGTWIIGSPWGPEGRQRGSGA